MGGIVPFDWVGYRVGAGTFTVPAEGTGYGAGAGPKPHRIVIEQTLRLTAFSGFPTIHLGDGLPEHAKLTKPLVLSLWSEGPVAQVGRLWKPKTHALSLTFGVPTLRVGLTAKAGIDYLAIAKAEDDLLLKGEL